MKKALSLILALVLCLSMCACGNNEQNNTNDQSNSNETKLTVENSTTYLKIGAHAVFTGKDWLMKPASEPNSIQCNSKAECKVSVSAASTNYDYVNTVITVRVSGTYDTYRGFEKAEDVAFSKEVTITCDIGGSGSANVVIFEGVDKEYQVVENSVEWEWEVVSISGTAARVG